MLAGRETRTLPVAVYNMLSFEQLSWGPLAAAALIVPSRTGVLAAGTVVTLIGDVADVVDPPT